MTLTGSYCRLMRWLGLRLRGDDKRGDDKSESAGDQPRQTRDDLTAIKGIGTVTQDRLYKAGIRTYADLANAETKAILEAVGQQNARSKIPDWIAKARKLHAQSNP